MIGLVVRQYPCEKQGFYLFHNAMANRYGRYGFSDIGPPKRADHNDKEIGL
jgi:hypothetical protein